MLRRMGRWVRTLLAGLIVLLWIAVIALWIRSHWRGDRVVFQSQREIPQLGPLRSLQHQRQYIAITGDGGICLATRATDSSDVATNPPSRWQASKDPSYPQPWGRLGRMITISSRGTLILNRISSGSTVTTFPTTSTFSLIVAPTTSPSAGTAGFGTMLGGGSLSSLTITAPSVTVSSGPGASATGTVSFRGGSTLQTASGGTLSLTLMTDFLTPLPPPENPPTGSFQFLAYRAGVAQDWMGRAHVVIVPFWFVASAMTLLLLLVLRSESLARRRRWRASHGCCVHCGYDLRASSERCPECGAVIPSKIPALSFQK